MKDRLPELHPEIAAGRVREPEEMFVPLPSPKPLGRLAATVLANEWGAGGEGGGGRDGGPSAAAAAAAVDASFCGGDNGYCMQRRRRLEILVHNISHKDMVLSLRRTRHATGFTDDNAMLLSCGNGDSYGGDSCGGGLDAVSRLSFEVFCSVPKYKVFIFSGTDSSTVCPTHMLLGVTKQLVRCHIFFFIHHTSSISLLQGKTVCPTHMLGVTTTCWLSQITYLYCY